MGHLNRSPRRHVRLRCTLTAGGLPIEGQILNLSATGLFVRVQRQLLEEELAAGSSFNLSFALPGDADLLHLIVEIVWPGTRHDGGGIATIGFGTKIREGTPRDLARLAAFVAGFRHRLLLVDDDPLITGSLQRLVGDELEVTSCPSAETALQLLANEEVAVLVADHHLPGMTGLELLREASEQWPRSNVVRILLTGDDAVLGEARALSRAGWLFDICEKVNVGRDFMRVVRRAADAYAARAEIERLNVEMERVVQGLRRENAGLRKQLKESRPTRLLGHSPKLVEIIEQIEAVAVTQATVLLTGESGVGKELAANAIHAHSRRADRLFLPVNCAAIPEPLLESELFGHARGAFTGATRARRGFFEEASGGTLFIDEISEASAPLQAKLLRVLERGEVRRVGESRPISVDVRLITATHRDLAVLVREGKFREDLYYRLAVVTLHLPPLRERAADIPLLVQHFLEAVAARDGKTVAGIAPGVIAALQRHSWPGNVRELQHVIESAVARVKNGEPLTRDLLPAAFDEGATRAPGAPPRSYDEAIDGLKQELIARALAESNGVVTRAARALQMKESRLAKLVTQLGLSPRPRISSAARRPSDGPDGS